MNEIKSSYLGTLKKYSVFSGRAQRKEYWTFILSNMVISIILSIVGKIIGGVTESLNLLYILFTFALFIPSVAVGIRRLHDTDRSGWWLLINLIPIVGVIILLVFMVKDSQPGENQYGPNPKKIIG